MPKNFEFVFAAYLITGILFAGYLLHLWRKERNIRIALEKLASSGDDASGGQASGETGRT
jgi:hypothetical protein